MSRMLKAFLFVLLLQWAPAKGADVEGVEKATSGDAETLKAEVKTEGSELAEEEEKDDDHEKGEEKDEEEDEEREEGDEIEKDEEEDEEAEEEEDEEKGEEDDEEGQEMEDHAENGEETSLSLDQINDIIKKHDKDEDGKLSLFELLQIYHEEDDQDHHGERDSTHGLEDAFHKVDADQDGLLNTDEMVSLEQLLSQQDDAEADADEEDAEEEEPEREDEEDEHDREFTEEDRDLMMREHDENKDNRLSFAEISQAYLKDLKVPSQIDESAPNPVVPVQLEQSFDKANADKDAGLDKHELMSFMTLVEESDL